MSYTSSLHLSAILHAVELLSQPPLDLQRIWSSNCVWHKMSQTSNPEFTLFLRQSYKNKVQQQRNTFHSTVHKHAAQVLIIIKGPTATPWAWADLTQVVLPTGHLKVCDKTQSISERFQRSLNESPLTFWLFKKNVYILDGGGSARWPLLQWEG